MCSQRKGRGRARVDSGARVVARRRKSWAVAAAAAGSLLVAGLLFQHRERGAGQVGTGFPLGTGFPRRSASDGFEKPSASGVPREPLSTGVDSHPARPREVVISEQLTPDGPVSDALEADDQKLSSEADLVNRAMEVAVRLSRRFPRDPYAMDVLGRAYLLEGDTDHAEACWRRCLEMAPGFLPAHRCLAEVATAREDHDQAVALMRQLLRVDPSSVDAHAALASSLMEAARFEEALVAAQDVARLAPQAPAAWLLMGKAHFQLNENSAAKACYERALSLAPQDSSALYGLGMACRRLGESDASRRYLEQYRQAKSRDGPTAPTMGRLVSWSWIMQELVWTYLAAGDVHANHGDLREAEQHWLQAAALDQGDLSSRRALAALYHEQGNTRQRERLMAQIRRIELSAKREASPQ